jgi:hypothetical protein
MSHNIRRVLFRGTYIDAVVKRELNVSLGLSTGGGWAYILGQRKYLYKIVLFSSIHFLTQLA